MILKSIELSKWSSDDYSKLYNWYDDFETFGRNRYLKKV